ncbi:MAG: hypothetical protein OJF49_000186 [Ktedonobacterales bacterium]|nr:MAG: hypothetical protein OJF49_000186 [Ktedonobacterales bacterium]
MTTPSTPSGDMQPRDATYWAQQGTNLKLSDVPAGAINLNVEGRSVVGPLQGFGKMWQKTYRVRLVDALVQPTEVIATWKENFQSFWPKGNRFYAPLTGITPGEVALLNLKTGGMPLSTGVLVLYADDESFTLMTPQGHMFAGWITFSAYVDDGATVAQAQVLMRANDPIYEMGLTMGGHKQEDKFWEHTLKSLAARFGVLAPVQIQAVCVDPKRKWAHAKNIRHNAAMRTVLSAPSRWFHRGRKQ